MKITFLGTGSMVPTKERNAFSVLFSHQTENILIDCGEGTQRQLKLVNFSPLKINKILITHWHGDHVLGLPGLLQTLAALNYTKKIEIYGPIGTKKFFDRLMDLFIREGKLKVSIKEIMKNGTFYKNDLIRLEATKLQHNTDCLAYAIIENDKRKINLEYLKKFGLAKHPLLGKLQKGLSITYKGHKISPEYATYLKKGKKVTIITDTKLCNQCYGISKNSDILICESTFMENLQAKASEFFHLTTKQAALIAKKSKSEKLILTHISQRYSKNSSKGIELEAKKIFKNSYLAEDFYSLDI